MIPGGATDVAPATFDCGAGFGVSTFETATSAAVPPVSRTRTALASPTHSGLLTFCFEARAYSRVL